MSNFTCCCSSRDLFWHGCRCNNGRKPRTVPINLSIPEVGYRRAWIAIRDQCQVLDPKKVAKQKEPTDVNEILQFMWWVEQESPDLYDSIARLLEELMFDKSKSPFSYVKLSLADGW